LLPRYQAVIFDEAHHIENVASIFFGRSFSQYQLLDLQRDIEQQGKLDLPAESLESLLALLGGLQRRIEDFLDIFPASPGRYPLGAFVAEISAVSWQQSIESLVGAIGELRLRLGEYGSFGEHWNSFVRRSEELEETLLDVALGSEDKVTDYIRWYEKRERAVIVSATPVDVAPILSSELYSSVDCCILTSATLSSGGTFSYLTQRLGLDENTRFLQFSSPFDYQKRSLIYVPESSFPEPSSLDYHSHLGQRILELLYLSQGRAMVLCTSFKSMEEIAALLQEKLDYPVLVQGSQSRRSLLNRFRDERHSVLVAVASFWEGVDVAGDSLSCVVIDKLPFEVPSDPVLQARIEKIKADGNNPFFSFQVPRAVLTLRQGVGRLMRATTDRGLIAIMDVRLYNKGYGKTFLRSLPPSPVSRELTEVQAFFQSDSICLEDDQDEYGE
jgi:ATP-dependent DNA helicase DinG